MSRSRGFLLAWAMVMALPGLTTPAWAQMYRWTDDRGSVHYTQGLDSVPERFRATARPLSFPAPPPEPRGPAPAAAPAAGTGEIRFTPGQPIWVDARINEAGTVRLMLDTGATVTTVNPRALDALGVSSRDARRGAIRGVTGIANALMVTVQSLEVAGLRAGPLRVVAHDSELGHGDGLLGRDFLDRFQVSIDNRSGVVTLTQK